MPLKFLADECVHKKIVLTLREHGYLVEYISEIDPGLDDHEIVKLATQESAILITEDSDFGEWVFVHNYNNTGVVFLRYVTGELDEIEAAILKVISKYKDNLYKKFIVITTKKIRIREI